MRRVIVFTIAILGLSVAALKAASETYHGQLSGNWAGGQFNQSGNLEGVPWYANADITPPELGPEGPSGPPASPKTDLGYVVHYNLCVGDYWSEDPTSGGQQCVTISGFLPARSSAITSQGANWIAVNIDISALTNPDVSRYCYAAYFSCTPPTGESITTFPLAGTFTTIPLGTPGSGRMSITGQFTQEQYYGEGGQVISTFNGTESSLEANFAGTIGAGSLGGQLLPVTVTPPAVGDGSNGSIMLFKGSMKLTITESE